MGTTTVIRKLDRQISSIARSFDSYEASDAEKLTFAEIFSNKLFLIYLISEGIPYSLFETIQEYTPFSENEWAEILDLSTKSLQRYKQDSRRFRPIQSEKIIEIAEATNKGLDVFGTMEKFKLWLDTPNQALGKLKPIDLLRDSYGKEMVIAELNSINHGIFA